MLVLCVGAGETPQGPATPTRDGRRRGSAGGSTSTFFKTYTEKVWGVSPAPSSRPTSLRSGSKAVLFTAREGDAVTPGGRPQWHATEVTSLIEEFQYPRLGPGHDVGDAAGSWSRSAGGEVLLQSPVTRGSTGATAALTRWSTSATGQTRAGRDRPRHLVHALLGAGTGDGPAPARRGAPAAADACTTATS